MPERRFAPFQFLRLACAALALAVAPGATVPAADGSPLVAAAADLRFALADITAAFEKDTGASVRLTYGSSGNFARQIRQGAPFEFPRRRQFAGSDFAG